MTVQVSSQGCVHAAALCESNQVGEGTRVWAFAHIMEGAVVGDDCNICDHAFIESGARIGNGVVVKNGVMIWDGVEIEDEAFIGPGVVFTNDRYPRSRHAAAARDRYRQRDNWLEKTIVRRGATIGAGATVVCGLTVGEYAMVAAGSLVTRDVPAYRLVAGSPARPVGWTCVCGHRLGEWLACGMCGRRYQLDGQVLTPER